MTDKTTPLTGAEKGEIRRFCGYPGDAPPGLAVWRYFQTLGLLEFRLAHLSQGEPAIARRYLSSLAALEASIDPASTPLKRDWSGRLCGFLGVPVGPNLATRTETHGI